jgi:outer membrane protein assembly factor BamB
MGFPENDDDIYLLQVDAEGKEVWSRTWEEGLANGAGLVQTRDGGYLLAGSYSPPEVMDREKNDFLFIKVDPQGREIWRNVWGDPQANDDAALLAATADGGYIAVGDTGGSLSAWNQDIALLKLDAQGQLIWRQVIKTDTHQMYGALLQHPDGGYVLVGSKAQNGRFDIFIIKTDADGRVAE